MSAHLRNHSSTDLIIALDFPRPDRAMAFVDQLRGIPVIYKIGLELFMAGGPDFVRQLVHQKKRVFLDLKFHDIPNTVARAAKQAALLHVDMLTIHLSGGAAMVRAVAKEFAEIPELRPKILGVSVLTSFDDVRWAEVTHALTGHAVEVANSALGLAEAAISWGVDGLVCSALELSSILAAFPYLYTVVPGIRPEGSSPDDQGRVTTPEGARQLGAGAIVVGRPITEAHNPLQIVEKILLDLSGPIK